MNDHLNKNSIVKRKGFTLIEILIATTIFATVMIIAVATISSAVDYRTKLRELRRTSEDTQKIADIITKDVREAKGNSNGVNILGSSFTKGTVMLLCGYSACNLKNDNPANTENANTLITFSENSYSVITSIDGIAYYKRETAALPNISTADNMITFWRGIVGYNPLGARIKNNIINQTGEIQDYETSITLNGFAGSSDTDQSKYQQHFVRFLIHSETKDFASKLPGGRAKADIKSTITLRNYH